MLAEVANAQGAKAGITISKGDKSGLPEDVKSAIGDRPIVKLTFSLDSEQIE